MSETKPEENLEKSEPEESEETQHRDFKHITPLNLRFDLGNLTKPDVPVTACSCDHCVHCNVAVDVDVDVDACGIWG